ncbi:MAG: hypothetical protein K6G50_00015 [bacterium]|nr:hypothetical protein [bacterium]
MRHNLIFTANSPGEISGFLHPLAMEAKKRHPSWKVTALLLPCAFASGQERRVAESIPEVDEVLPASAFWKMLLYGLPDKKAALVHLGGDLMYASALVWRTKMPAWSYMWGRRWWDSFFEGYFAKDEAGMEWIKRHKLPLEKSHIVGSLVVDSVFCRLNGAKVEHNPKLVSFMPGSRLAELSALTPFFLRIAEVMHTYDAELQFQMLVSPFIDKQNVKSALENAPLPEVGGTQGVYDGEYLYTKRGQRVRIVMNEHMRSLANSGFAVAIPGTKTAEAAILGVPEFVILPCNKPEMLPLGGILGSLDFLPGGKHLKGRLILLLKSYLAKKIGFLAQPNIALGQMIVPEYVDTLNPEETAARVYAAMHDEAGIAAQKRAFASLYSQEGRAAARMFDIIERRLQWQ